METSASLLERLRTAPDEAAWRRLHDLYHPLIRRWLLRDPTLREEADDLVQEVMAVLVRELPAFQRQRTGSFRRWLRSAVSPLMAWRRPRWRKNWACRSTPCYSPSPMCSASYGKRPRV